MELGNFDLLAEDYGRYRPGYSPSVANAIRALVPASGDRFDAVDVGAGTGIWSRILARCGARVTAVEPSGPMLDVGKGQNGTLDIVWRSGQAEATGLPDGCADLVTMASSFHWPDYDGATREFRRILRPGGVFAALWNPRRIEVNPLLVEIEDELKRRVPELKRVSSGRSGFCDGLHDRLAGTEGFADVLYIEGRHVELQSPERYIGLWRSVNDIRVQAGEARFGEFLSWIESRIRGMETIEATYTTRAWVATRA